MKLLIKQSGCLDLKKLIISSGRACWIAYLDMYILDADGSVLDACMLAAVAALSGLTSLPQIAVDEHGVKLSRAMH